MYQTGKGNNIQPIYIFDLDYTLYSKYNVNDKGTDDEFYDSFNKKKGFTPAHGPQAHRPRPTVHMSTSHILQSQRQPYTQT